MGERSEQLLLSFVVPCYNVEKYIQRCLDSIYASGISKDCFEVICVNDYSTDQTKSVLDYNVGIHNNVRVITHEKNKGWGGPRNTGLREAKGKYLWFVDADDMICGDVEKAIEMANRNELDVLCFNYRRIDDEGTILSDHLVFGNVTMQIGLQFAKEAFAGGIVNHMGFVWRFMYRTAFLRSHQLCFPEQVCWEDTVFMPKAIIEADRIGSIPDVMYSYRVNSDSISNVFGRVYPAKLIYDYAFCAGGDLLHYSDEVKDEELKSAFRKTAIAKYINGFQIHLFRTSLKEQKIFYGMIAQSQNELTKLKQVMKPFNRLLLAPVIGPVFAGSASIMYKLTH